MASTDEFVVDLTTYKDRVGTRVVPGRYRVRVDDVELDKTSKGDPMINVWLVVTEGDFEGATIIDRLLPQHPKALFRVVGFMQAIGLHTPKKRMKLNIRQFLNKVLEVDIEDGDPFNNRVKSEVRGYYRVERGTESEVPDVTDPDAEEPLDYEVLADEHSNAAEEEPPASNVRQEVPATEAGDDSTTFAPIDLENLEL